MPQTLTAARLHTPAKIWDNPVITLDDAGMIVSIESDPHGTDETILVPTYLDVHVHGAMNHDVMEGTTAALGTISRFLATRGVGHFLATTVTAPVDATLRGLVGIAEYIEGDFQEGAVPLGVHLEGPFVSHAKRGVHPPEHILPPSIALFDRFQEAARGHIRLITIAPEVPGAMELTRHAVGQGVRVSIGHTNATTEETRAAIAAGATTATHTFNAMRALDHREPGVLGVVLDDDDLYAELICDGVHVAPEVVRLFYKAKGMDRAMLVTDGMSAMGMPEGTYMLGGFEVVVADGRCMANGVLAGSVLTMDKAVANFARYTGVEFSEVAKLASNNPAQMLGVAAQLAIGPGQPANFNRYGVNGSLQGTILRGRQVI
jgi:N-acetylglucosamine-6-phosphate deacetylase